MKRIYNLAANCVPALAEAPYRAAEIRSAEAAELPSIASSARCGKQILPPQPSTPRRISIRLYLAALFVLFGSLVFAETIYLQSFEGSANDTWSYTANPSPDSKRIWWGSTTEAMGGATAYQGTIYWAGWDLDNVESTVTFSTLILQAGFTYNVSFYYFTKNLATTNDYCRYSVKYDNSTNWDNWVTVNNNSNAWTAVSVEVPSGSNYLRLRLSSKFDGSTKYAHWDYIKVEKTPIPNSAPVVSNVTASQRTDGSKIVDIWYDVSDADGDTLSVSLRISNDNGNTFGITPNPANLSGAVGENILSGSGKHIIWNAGAESIGFDGSAFRIKIVAEDNQDPPMPANFIFVEGGTFHNGTSNVTLSSFYIDMYEVTQASYQAVMGTNPATAYGVGSTYPVYYVSWFNAIEYCNRRSLQEGLTPCYSYGTYGTNPDSWPTGWNTNYLNHTNVSCNWTANGYRLPTEMEWQFAARGGNQTHNYTYSGSNDLNTVGWYWDNSDSTTHAVGTKAANELGTFDMSGNVWEWVWDIYGSYPGGAQTDPHGATSGSNRVLRGGGWHNDADYCTVSSRVNYNATGTGHDVGFRLVRVSP